MSHHQDDAHALVINRILALPSGSAEANAAHRDYQETRVVRVRPKLMRQRVLLTRALGMSDAEAASSGLDASVAELDQAIAADWFALDARICPAPSEAA